MVACLRTCFESCLLTNKDVICAGVIEERLHLHRSTCREGLNWAASERAAEPGCPSHAPGPCAGACLRATQNLLCTDSFPSRVSQ